MNLESQITKSINNISTDSYSMSIGEVVNLYKDGDIDISPLYQRYFRWSINQKSDLIESIILGIPIPPIFVAQDSSGKWDLIDGLQRISTIMEFMGILKKKDEEDNLYPASQMIGTKFLPALEGMWWDNDKDPEHSLSEEIRRKFKRNKLNFIIIDSTVNPKAKYEMFQRLNTNSSELTGQEIRNCLMIMIDGDYFNLVMEMCEIKEFQELLSITDRQSSEQFDKELVVRYLISQFTDLEKINSQQDIGDFLTIELVNFMEANNSNFETIKKDFYETVVLLNKTLGSNAFKKFNSDKGEFEGAFSLSMYETIMLGISSNINKWKCATNLEEVIKSIPTNALFLKGTYRGKRAINRFKDLNLLSKELFRDEN